MKMDKKTFIAIAVAFVTNLVEQLAKLLSHRGESELHVPLTVGPAKVRADDHRPENIKL